MVLTIEVIRRTPQFQAAWLLGLNKHTKMTQEVIQQQNLPDLCDRIIGLVPSRSESSAEKVSLYMLAVLAGGAVVIYQMQTDLLQKDMTRLVEMTKKKNFIAMFAEQFDRDREATQVKREKSKLRAVPIVSLEEFDELVDLANLQAISASIGINAPPESLQIMDAIPNPPNVRNVFSDERPDVSTFIDGNGSDERRDVFQALFEDIVTSAAIPERKRQSILLQPEEEPFPEQPPQEQPSVAVVPVEEPPIVPPESPKRIEEPPVELERPETPLRVAQCLLRSPRLEEPPVELQRPETPLRVAQCALWSPRREEPPNDDLVIVPPELHQPMAEYVELVNNLPENAEIPPPPFDLMAPPPAKKPRVEEEEKEEEAERHRRRQSSLPATPGNRTALTNLETSAMVTTEELSFELDSQIHQQPVVQRKISKKQRDAIYGDEDLEIDAAVQKVLFADWSSLVKKIDEVKVKSCDRVLGEIDDPSPFTRLGGKFARELRSLFKSTTYQELVPVEEEQPKEEIDVPRNADPIQFAFITLKTPEHTTLQFEEEYRPPEVETLLNRPPEEEQTTVVSERPMVIEEPIEEPTYFASRCLLSTPDSKKEQELIEALQMEPLPQPEMQPPQELGVVEDLETREGARRRQKSSIGVGLGRTAEQLDSNEFRDLSEEDFEKVRFGSLQLTDMRQMLHRKLISDAEQKSPEWLDFNEFTANFSRKHAAMAFEALLQNLKLMKLSAKQDEPFDTIFVRSEKLGEQ